MCNFNLKQVMQQNTKLIFFVLVSPVCYDTGEVSTLGTLLKQVLPESTYSKWSKKQLSTIIHGMEVRPEIPLQWLSENLSYPDNFLHIALVYPKSSFE